MIIISTVPYIFSVIFRNAEVDSPAPTFSSSLGFSVRECSQGKMSCLGHGPPMSLIAKPLSAECMRPWLIPLAPLVQALQRSTPDLRRPCQRGPLCPRPSFAGGLSHASSLRAELLWCHRWENSSLPSPRWLQGDRQHEEAFPCPQEGTWT